VERCKTGRGYRFHGITRQGRSKHLNRAGTKAKGCRHVRADVVLAHFAFPRPAARRSRGPEFAPALWLQMALWVPLTGLLSLALLSPIKGAVVAMQWFGGMHGFARAYAKRRSTAATRESVAH
jgi:hypothetical protein